MARHTRKGRNPGPVDEWLDTLGYYRKNVAYDETCLFRAVSEQLFGCQLFHEKIRKDCIDYGRVNHRQFLQCFEKRSDWDIYLDRLGKHMAVCGQTEIQLISKTYKKGVLLFDGLTRCMKDVTNLNPYDDDMLLCHMGEDHYDAVYKKDYIQDAGFCQSIVYSVLYENVFQIPKVSNIVQTMLYQKPPAGNSSDLEVTDINSNVKDAKVKSNHDDEKGFNDLEYMLKTSIAPFPFKVAKALDPTIYRNIEYDTWTEMRKEMRLGDWYYGDANLIQGTGCVLHDNDEQLKCYIQEILKNEKCVVYITSRAEKRTVNIKDLRPEEDAKPWPLPYRFSKNLVLSIPKIELPDKKGLRKKREKKRCSSKCSNDSESQVDNVEAATAAVSAFEGAPLQMQSDIMEAQQQQTVDAVKEGATSMIPEQGYTYQEYNWENSGDVSQEQIMWAQVPTTSQSVYFNVKTPDVYQTADPRFYYPSESYQPRYTVWPNGEYVPPLPPQDQIVPPSPHGTEIGQSPDFTYIFSSDGSCSPSCCCADNKPPPPYATPPSPQVEMYQPVYPTAPPVTPVILASDMSGMMMPSPQVAMYSPGIEMPFIPTSPFIYPPTPPAAWYPSGINSQGFIFPTANAPTANGSK